MDGVRFMVESLLNRLWNLPESAWVLVLGALAGLAVLAALIWKIIRSEEGFLFGYGDWVVGKWQAVSENPAEGCRVREQPGQPPAGRQPKRDATGLKKALEVKSNVLTLSRLLDGDLVCMMTSRPQDWNERAMRAVQTLVSGATRIVRPTGRCRCGFFILDEHDERYLIMAAGEGYGGSKRPRLAIDCSCAGRAFLTGECYYCKDTATDPVYYQSNPGKRDFRAIACIPVKAGMSVFGVICLDAEQPGAFTQEDFVHLEALAVKLAAFCALFSMQAGHQALAE
jgi:putative methionine-R-sulfoxide reductase with GAF domain